MNEFVDWKESWLRFWAQGWGRRTPVLTPMLTLKLKWSFHRGHFYLRSKVPTPVLEPAYPHLPWAGAGGSTLLYQQTEHVNTKHISMA